MTEEELQALLKESLKETYEEGRTSGFSQGVTAATEYAAEYADNLRRDKHAERPELQAAILTLDKLVEALQQRTP